MAAIILFQLELFLIFSIQQLNAQHPPLGFRCGGRNYDDSKCRDGEGDCDNSEECLGDLTCGENNCQQYGSFYHKKDDWCAMQNFGTDFIWGIWGPWTLCTGNCGLGKRSRLRTQIMRTGIKNLPAGKPKVSMNIPLDPPIDQRCRGGNYPPGRRCCTPEDPCDEGVGDCDEQADGGQHDGDQGCKGDLVCGSNNCKQFGHFYHPKDDCCEKQDENVVGIVDLKVAEIGHL
eukprot:GFUD01031170.1.p1 GENE.GFUD01031170.1~~GFUD01031170.1.p1  ORF type:complete len:231 (-),score=44.53 GFUD01031170.1:92-784(-)